MTDILLSELANADIDWLASVGGQQHFLTGTRFSSLDDARKANFYIVLDGYIAAFSHDISKAANLTQPRHETVRLFAGDVIGTAHLFNVPTPQLRFEVVEESIVLAIPQHQLDDKLQADVKFAANFYRAIDRILSYRIERLIEQPEKLRFTDEHKFQDVLDVFSEFRDSDLNWLVNAGKVERYSTNDFLLQAGRPTDFLYIILDGRFSVALPETKANPLALCFECPIQTASTMAVVTTLSKGEIAGAIAFLDARPMPVTVRAAQESLVLAIPRTIFNLHLQQDLGFATRFYRILGPQLFTLSLRAMELRGEDLSLSIQRQSDDMEFEGELDLDSLQRMSSGANRFSWMLSYLGIGVA
jgi:bacteriocin-type transport-associated protein